MTIPSDPSLGDLQFFWEKQFHQKSSATWRMMCQSYERWMKYFGEDRRPRDIFRSDIAEYREWLQRKGWKDSSICNELERLRRLYRLFDELEIVELGFNPATGMSPPRIRA